MLLEQKGAPVRVGNLLRYLGLAEKLEMFCNQRKYFNRLSARVLCCDAGCSSLFDTAVNGAKERKEGKSAAPHAKSDKLDLFFFLKKKGFL